MFKVQSGSTLFGNMLTYTRNTVRIMLMCAGCNLISAPLYICRKSGSLCEVLSEGAILSSQDTNKSGIRTKTQYQSL